MEAGREPLLTVKTKVKTPARKALWIAAAISLLTPGMVAQADPLVEAAEQLNQAVQVKPVEIPCQDPLALAESKMCTQPVAQVCNSGLAELERVLKISAAVVKTAGALKKQTQRDILAERVELARKYLQEAYRRHPKTHLPVNSPLKSEMEARLAALDLQIFEAAEQSAWRSREAVGDLQGLVDRTKKMILSRSRTEDGVNPGRIRTLTEAKLITSDFLKSVSPTQRKVLLNLVNQVCGPLGMAVNAVAINLPRPDTTLASMHYDGYFIVCPGLAVDLGGISGLGIEKYAAVLGHELGHLVQGPLIPAGRRTTFTTEAREEIANAERTYDQEISAALAACPPEGVCSVDRFREVARRRQSKIGPLTRVENTPDKELDFLDCLKSHDLLDMNNGEEQLSVLAFQREVELGKNPGTARTISAWLKYFGGHAMKSLQLLNRSALLGRKPDSVDLHQTELVADYWGAVALNDALKRTDLGQRENLTRQSLRMYCAGGVEGKWSDAGDHPPDSYRIERALSHPGIRTALGCRSSSTRVWCGD